MNYCGLMKSDIANGVGVRVTLWCSGCSIHCEGCQNPETWDFNSGKPFTTKAMNDLVCELEKPYVKGITFTGGNPLEPQNAPTIEHIIRVVRTLFTDKDIWLYTGRTLKIQDFSGGEYASVLSNCDYVVDGAYLERQRDLTIAFRGSSNQRIIDVKRSLAASKIVTTNLN